MVKKSNNNDHNSIHSIHSNSNSNSIHSNSNSNSNQQQTTRRTTKAVSFRLFIRVGILLLVFQIWMTNIQFWHQKQSNNNNKVESDSLQTQQEDEEQQQHQTRKKQQQHDDNNDDGGGSGSGSGAVGGVRRSLDDFKIIKKKNDNDNDNDNDKKKKKKNDHQKKKVLELQQQSSYSSSLLLKEEEDDEDDHSLLTKKKKKQKKKSKFAYAFLVSGIDISSPYQYRNYIYNILIASKILHSEESESDIIVMIQFIRSNSNNSNNNTTTTNTQQQRLPQTDLQLLELNSNIQIHYLPELIRDNFYLAQLEKFHILRFSQYERVMYLDSDIMPLRSLDYVMEFSLKHNISNVILSWFTEPAQGGLFVLEPNLNNWMQLQYIIERREKQALQLSYPHWDPIIGWGIQPLQQEWKGIQQPTIQKCQQQYYNTNNQTTTQNDSKLLLLQEAKHSYNWTFHGDFADQGLLYYYTMFGYSEHNENEENNESSENQNQQNHNVAILFLDYIEIWDGLGNLIKTIDKNLTTVIKNQKELTMKSTIQQQQKPQQQQQLQKLLKKLGESQVCGLFQNKLPHSDFVHFTGDTKPWESQYKVYPTELNQIKSLTDYWYYELNQIRNEFYQKYPNRSTTQQKGQKQKPLFQLPLKYKRPKLGRYPTYRSMIGSIQKKYKQREKQQQQEE